MNFRVPYEKWKHTRKIRCIWRRCTYRSRAICTYAYDTHQQQQKRNRKWDKQDGFRVSLKLYYTYLFIKLWNTSAYLYRQINAYPDISYWYYSEFNCARSPILRDTWYFIFQLGYFVALYAGVLLLLLLLRVVHTYMMVLSYHKLSWSRTFARAQAVDALVHVTTKQQQQNFTYLWRVSYLYISYTCMCTYY